MQNHHRTSKVPLSYFYPNGFSQSFLLRTCLAAKLFVLFGSSSRIYLPFILRWQGFTVACYQHSCGMHPTLASIFCCTTRCSVFSKVCTFIPYWTWCFWESRFDSPGWQGHLLLKSFNLSTYGSCSQLNVKCFNYLGKRICIGMEISAHCEQRNMTYGACQIFKAWEVSISFGRES